MGATETGVFTLAREAGIELEPGAAMPWLTNRGHRNPSCRTPCPRALSAS